MPLPHSRPPSTFACCASQGCPRHAHGHSVLTCPGRRRLPKLQLSNRILQKAVFSWFLFADCRILIILSAVTPTWLAFHCGWGWTTHSCRVVKWLLGNLQDWRPGGKKGWHWILFTHHPGNGEKAQAPANLWIIPSLHINHPLMWQKKSTRVHHRLEKATQAETSLTLTDLYKCRGKSRESHHESSHLYTGPKPQGIYSKVSLWGGSWTPAPSGVLGSGRIRLHWAAHAPSHCNHSINGLNKPRKEWRSSNFFWKWESQAEEYVWWLHSGHGYIKCGQETWEGTGRCCLPARTPSGLLDDVPVLHCLWACKPLGMEEFWRHRQFCDTEHKYGTVPSGQLFTWFPTPSWWV